jgi:hypothetical protein
VAREGGRIHGGGKEIKYLKSKREQSFEILIRLCEKNETRQKYYSHFAAVALGAADVSPLKQ